MSALSERDYDLIDRYVTDRATHEELQEVQARMKDPAFRAHLQLIQNTEHIVREQAEQRLRRRFGEIDAEVRRSPLRFKQWWIWLFVALLAIVAALVLLRSEDAASPKGPDPAGLP